MAWKDNALGIVVDSTMDVDYASLKQQGLSFVVIECGLGFDVNPALSDQLSKANAAGLPVIVQYTPYPALDDYTFDALPREQAIALHKWLDGKKFAALVISADRYWTGVDLETNHIPLRIATGTAINTTTSVLVSTFSHDYSNVTGMPMLVRTNDNFVQKYSPDMGGGWTDRFGFFLADWRYRTRAADGSYSLYTIFPALTIKSIADLRATLPPDGSKNPLVPGSSPQLKFWEFTGSVTMPTSLVKGWNGVVKKVKAVLFNGDETALKTYLQVAVVNPPPDDPGTPSDPDTPDDPGTPSDPGTPVTVDLAPLIAQEKANGETLAKIEQHLVSIEQFMGKIAGHFS